MAEHRFLETRYNSQIATLQSETRHAIPNPGLLFTIVCLALRVDSAVRTQTDSCTC